MNKKTSKIVILSLVVLALSLALVVYRASRGGKTLEDTAATVTTAPANELPTAWTKKEWDDNHSLNGDYVGTLRFESGLMNQDIVQGATNDSYIRTNWKTMEHDEEGTSFLDSASVYKSGTEIKEDKNIVMYGHYVYPQYDETRTHMFTPLHVLKDQKDYEANKYADFLMDDEVRRYQVANVFYVELVYDEASKSYLYTPNDMEYYYPSFTSTYLASYKKAIQKNIERFGVGYGSEVTGIDISENDQLLTLQTCVENHDELRLIVICKEIGRFPLTK